MGGRGADAVVTQAKHRDVSRDVTSEKAILALLTQRGPGKTICPSEAARLIAGPDGDWRGEMERVHAASDALLNAGDIRLSWQGKPIEKRRGPYRITRR
ncbi:MAG: DUF3253 domain-containing protein [Pseudomonadota bacterium]